MSLYFGNRLQSTSTSTGTGDFAVSVGGATTGVIGLSPAIGSHLYYAIEHTTLDEWEVGLGFMADATTLQRVGVVSSSGGGGKVPFSAGAKRVSQVAPANILAGDLAFFGDGSDGDVTISNNVSLTRDMFYRNLTVTGGITTNGFRVFVSGTLDLSAMTGQIEYDGNNGGGSSSAGGGSAASTLSSNTVGGGGAAGAGATGTTGAGASPTLVPALANCQGGAGGRGGPGGSSSGGSGGSSGAVNAPALAMPMRTPTTSPFRGSNIVVGGQGGGGGSSGAGDGTNTGGGGGGGGSGGGVVWIAARHIIRPNSASATGHIRSWGGNGGFGAAGNSTGSGGGGGGGGGGGVVYIIYGSASGTPGNLILDARGGNGGNGGWATGKNGGSGGNGGRGGRIVGFDFGTGVVQEVVGAAPTVNPTSGSSSAGGTGGQGGACQSSV